MTRPGFGSLVATALRLGIADILRVLIYRILKRWGYFKRRCPVREFTGAAIVPGINFAAVSGFASGTVTSFTAVTGSAETSPEWFVNPLNSEVHSGRDSHWSQCNDFDPEFGDIKTLWDKSRFSWYLRFVQSAIASGDVSLIRSANDWMSDWLDSNPVNQGPNWMCGQETAIRLNHVLIAESLLRRHTKCESDLEDFVYHHCDRIAATTSYAVAQKNNHAISEAVGLYVGGYWLTRFSRSHVKKGRKYRAWGRRMLQKSVAKLTLEDGTFSQFSTNYHRLFVDTLTLAELWRRESGDKEFSAEFYNRARLAVNWLIGMLDSSSGDVPVIGANDGAHVYQLAKCDYRDFRPSVQLAAATFLNARAVSARGHWDEPLEWLGVDMSSREYKPERLSVHAAGGFAVLRHRNQESVLVGRGASTKFRPSQADVLHSDFWWHGRNIARDAGTFSYAADRSLAEYFKGTVAHNTVQFDGRDQMRSIGTFLFADWVACEMFEAGEANGNLFWQAAYTDYRGCRHMRRVDELDLGWRITDSISGPFNCATVRWRLDPGLKWHIAGNGAVSDDFVISLSSNAEFEDVRLEEGFESRYYLEKVEIPVLAARVGPGDRRIVTQIGRPG